VIGQLVYTRGQLTSYINVEETHFENGILLVEEDTMGNAGIDCAYTYS